jgi:hypothetical protein
MTLRRFQTHRAAVALKLTFVMALAMSTAQSQSGGVAFNEAEKWTDYTCVGQEVCSVGDFNGDGRDDIVAFVRSSQTGTAVGDAWVALSIPNLRSFAQAQKWSDWICVRQEVCVVGDFNRDGLDDVAAFVGDTQAGAAGEMFGWPFPQASHFYRHKSGTTSCVLIKKSVLLATSTEMAAMILCPSSEIRRPAQDRAMLG